MRRPTVIHPFLFAIYPVIALLAHNIEEIKVVVSIRALVIALLIATGMFISLSLMVKSRLKAGLITTLTMVLFFSYGHIYTYLETHPSLAVNLGRHRLLAPIWLLIFILGCLLIFRSNRPLDSWNRFLNIVGVIALVLPLGQMGTFAARSLSSVAASESQVSLMGLEFRSDEVPPDIYYIVLDAYARDDVLQSEFDLDNSSFLSQLEAMGFYIARCSQSNYAQTQLSLASTLNLNYLQVLNPAYSPELKTRVGLEDLIRRSAVRRALESLGYKIVAFETGFKGTQLEDADIYLSPNSDFFHASQIAGGPNSFEVLLLRELAALLFADGAVVIPKFLQPDLNNPRRIHRDLILFDLEQLRELPSKPGPKFVFAHLVIPHPPYVFSADGDFTDFDKEYAEGYRDQVTYLNKRLLELLPYMIASSSTPPVIILQGDHGSIGSKPNSRTSIFNAYFLPDAGIEILYANISPVNSFRVIFNQYFNGKFEQLEDISYYSVYSDPFDFTMIPNGRPGCEQ